MFVLLHSKEFSMFVLSPSLAYRIILFGFVCMYMVLPASFDFLERGLVASLVMFTFSMLLPSVTVKYYEPEGWVMWLDIALSWIMLMSYTMVLILIVSEGLNLNTFFVSAVGLSFAAYCAGCWYGFCALFNDDLFRSSS